MNPPMIVLGVDPGIALTGWGIIQTIGSEVKTTDYGCIRTNCRQSAGERLLLLFQKFQEILSRYQPDVVALEEFFLPVSSPTTVACGQARGVILLAAAQKMIPLVEYNPKQVKLALTGYGGATKIQMQEMARRLLSLSELPRPDDAADALAIAICHLQCSSYQQRLAKVK